MKNHPRPKNFPYDEVFYDNKNIALMFGTYKKNKNKSLGMRWIEAESELGYPNIFGHPMWMVVPNNLAIYILEGIKLNEKSNKNIDWNKIESVLNELKVI